MTKEELKTEVMRWTPALLGMGKECTDKTLEAQKAVVDMLEYQPQGDLISRQSVLEQIQQSLSKYGSTYTTDMLNMWGLFEELITNTPPAEPQEWISVKDSRKPKIRERVWATDCDGEVWIMYYNGCDCYFNEFGDVFADDIIAWQPIIEPSPYKGDEDEH